MWTVHKARFISSLYILTYLSSAMFIDTGKARLFWEMLCGALLLGSMVSGCSISDIPQPAPETPMPDMMPQPDHTIPLEELCNDNFQNGRETGVDCGGPDCRACGLSQGCLEQLDCDSGLVCSQSLCLLCILGDERISSEVCGNPIDERYWLEVCNGEGWVRGQDCIVRACVIGDMRDLVNSCGINGQGIQPQVCLDGQWQNNNGCLDEDTCRNGATDQEFGVCGFENTGYFNRICQNGAWVRQGGCQGVGVCAQGDMRTIPMSCGKNGTSALPQVCENGNWISLHEMCFDVDECINGQNRSVACETIGMRFEECVGGLWSEVTACGENISLCTLGEPRTVSNACGFNGRGEQLQLCQTGQNGEPAWVPNGMCINDPDVCTNGHSRNRSCGRANLGVFPQICREGQWFDEQNATCNHPDICTNGDTQTVANACGFNGQGISSQVCANGQWVEDDECVDEDVCINGTTQIAQGCGAQANGTQLQRCEGGQWIDEGPCEIEEDGDCTAGQMRLERNACDSGIPFQQGWYSLQTCDNAQNWNNTGECSPAGCPPESGSTSVACGYENRGSMAILCDANGINLTECLGVYYRSCRELWEAGERREGLYEIDPGGPSSGVTPFMAYCNFEEGGRTLAITATEPYETIPTVSAPLSPNGTTGRLTDAQIFALLNQTEAEQNNIFIESLDKFGFYMNIPGERMPGQKSFLIPTIANQCTNSREQPQEAVIISTPALSDIWTFGVGTFNDNGTINPHLGFMDANVMVELDNGPVTLYVGFGINVNAGLICAGADVARSGRLWIY